MILGYRILWLPELGGFRVGVYRVKGQEFRVQGLGFMF